MAISRSGLTPLQGIRKRIGLTRAGIDPIHFKGSRRGDDTGLSIFISIVSPEDGACATKEKDGGSIQNDKDCDRQYD